MNSHINESPFECPDCANLFQDLGQYLEHMQKVHGETIPIKEEMEPSEDEHEQGGSVDNENMHYSSDDDKKTFEPPQKDEAVPVPVDVILSSDVDTTPKCVECGKLLDSDQLKWKSVKQKQRTCRECRKSSIKRTADQTYPCDTCGKEFPNLLSVRLHRRSHSGSYNI